MTGILAALAANRLESLAVLFGLVSVYLSSRQRIASWPTAILNVGIFFVIFWQSKLYADSVLQLVYLSLSVYGWWAWRRGGEARTPLRVSRAGRRLMVLGTAGALVCGLGLGAFLDLRTDSPVPYLDAVLTAFSLLAQWMMTRKILENWAVWILVDLLYVPMFIARGLPITAVQYAVFLILAVMGWASWKHSWTAEQVGGRGGPVRSAPPREGVIA